MESTSEPAESAVPLHDNNDLQEGSEAAHSEQTHDIKQQNGKTLNGGKKKRKQICRFYNLKSGCRAGEACPFVHDEAPRTNGKTASKSQPQETIAPVNAAQVDPQHDAVPKETAERGFQAPTVASSRIVARPVPKAQLKDPREFQLGQIRRRFSPSEEQRDGATHFTFGMSPSDPDFPFEMDDLKCTLTVPSQYPKARPALRITNKEMRRGFQINVERGFDEIAKQNPDATLLGMMNRLDKQLEALLTGQMADTVTIVRNTKAPETERKATVPSTPAVTSKPTLIVHRQAEVFTTEQRERAQTKRQADIRQIVARLGKLPNFRQATDGVTFTIPFQIHKKDGLPDSVRQQSALRLIVPELYNLHPPRIEMLGNSDPAARNIERSFGERARSLPDATLLALINYVSQHALAMAAPKEKASAALNDAEMVQPRVDVPAVPKEDVPVAKASTQLASDLDEKSHIHVIPRPPEWSHEGGDSDEHDDWSSDSSFAYDSGDENDEEGEEETESRTGTASTGPSMPAEKGILVTFPGLEMHGIELLELVLVNITIKCDRCKDTMDVQRLRNNETGAASGMKDEHCKKCANNLAAGFRMDLMHINSARAGYLDLDGCTIVDMLPSNFIPTCSECSTPYPAPGVVAVRGDSSMAICRECHRKMSFRIPETKFLKVTTATVRANRLPSRRKAKENLGIVAGQELPKRGRCSHYAKSYRWFRFSCCSRVFPCDRCHDEVSDHPEEHANRMICGFCSREQNYRPEDCGVCKAVLIGKRGHGFWEGGKGTRDKARMSRKDPRKYKRRPGTKVGSK